MDENKNGCTMHLTQVELDLIRSVLKEAIDAIGHPEDSDFTAKRCERVLWMIETDPSLHVGIDDYIEGDRLMTICVGCGATWERVEGTTEDGSACDMFLLNTAGDGSCL